MKKGLLAVLSIVVVIGFVGCGSESPTAPTDELVLMPTNVTDFRLDSFSPESGSTVRMGDTIELSGSYTKSEEDFKADLWSGFVWVRDDGATYLTTISGGGGRGEPPWPHGSSIGLDPRNGFRDFFAGHTATPTYVMGTSTMMDGNFGVDWSQVKHRWQQEVWWRVE